MRYRMTATVVSLAFLAGLVALSFVRGGAVWFLASLAARIESHNVLAFRLRRAITDRLAETGMVALHKARQIFAEELGVSSESIRKHLDILRAHDAVICVRKGARVFIGPRNGVYRNRREQVAAALTADAIGYEIGVAICSRPEKTQKDIVARVNDTLEHSLTRVAIRKRLEELANFKDRPACQSRRRTLQEGGSTTRVIQLVKKVRDGRYVRYKPTTALRNVVANRHMGSRPSA